MQVQHSKTFDTSHAFLRVTVTELSTLKQVQFFWPTLYMFTVEGRIKTTYYYLFIIFKWR